MINVYIFFHSVWHLFIWLVTRSLTCSLLNLCLWYFFGFFDIDFAIFVFMATFAVGRVHLIRNFTIDIKHVPYIYIVYYMLLYWSLFNRM